MRSKLLLLLLLCPFFVFAQMKTLAEGPLFEEPESGYARILMLKNGGTAFVHVTAKDGIELRLYDAQHQETIVKVLKPGYGKLKSFSMEGLFGIDGDLNLFISEINDGFPTLYRLRIDEQSGDLKDMQTIATLNKTNIGQAFGSTYGHVPDASFFVHKDLYSDNYGVIRYNTFESDRSKRVELIQFTKDGREIARNFLSSPGNEYKYTDLLDFTVVGTRVYALLYSYNTPSSGAAANELLLATVENGNVDYHNVGSSLKRRINKGILRFNPKSGNLVFFTTEYMGANVTGLQKAQIVYNVVVKLVDPVQHTIRNGFSLDESTVAKKYRQVFKSGEFGFLPRELYVNQDGSVTLLLEDISIKRIVNTSTGTTRDILTLLSSAVIRYREDGQEISAALVPKSQKITPTLFQQTDEIVTNGFAHLSGGNQYKGVYYLNGKKHSFLFMNDIEENAGLVQKGKLTTISGVGDCEAWVYDLNSTVSPTLPIPVRTHLFSKESKKDRNLALFALSDADYETGIYATLKLEKGRGKKVRMVWMGMPDTN